MKAKIGDRAFPPGDNQPEPSDELNCTHLCHFFRARVTRQFSYRSAYRPLTLLSPDAPRAASDEQTARISMATRWRVAAHILLICHLSFVICHLSAAEAMLTGPASGIRDASNGPGTTARQGRRESSNGPKTKDHGHRPARAGTPVFATLRLWCAG